MFQMATERYWKTVNALIDQGIVSRTQWQTVDYGTYRRYKKGFRKPCTVRKVLRDAARFMYWNRVYGQYLLSKEPVLAEYIYMNPFHRILTLNNYDPRVVGTIMYKWSMLTSEKNTVWLWGGPETGVPYLGEALAYCCPIVGCIEWRNRANPLGRCWNAMLFWLDGGLFCENSIDSVLRVLRGENTLLVLDDDWGGTRHREVNRTPVLLCTPNDVRYTYNCKNDLCNDHKNALADCMYVITLREPYADACSVTCKDAREFIRWAADHPHMEAERLMQNAM